MSAPDLPPHRLPDDQLDQARMRGLAHDVNQLLTTILGRAQLLLERNEDPELRRHLELMSLAARDAADLLQEVLGPSTAGRHAEAVWLAVIVKQSLELTRHRPETAAGGEGGEAIGIEERVGEDIAVLAGAAGLRAVLCNLLNNALDAMPAGGSLELDTERHGDAIELHIRDSGVGMDQATLDRLFTPGFSGGKPGGHGLGLASCQRMVQSWGGGIDASSQLGSGSTFTLRLLAAKSAPLPQPCRSAAQAAGELGPQRILVVDDEPHVRDLIVEILGEDGHVLTLVSQGQQALDRFRPGAFDLVLTDLRLPGMDGAEVTRWIRSHDPRVAIAVMTGWGGELAAAQLDEKVVDLLVAKPLDVSALRSLVATAASITAQRRADEAAAGK